MLQTIPVWKTVAEAYTITFGDLKGVALLAWLPLLITLGFGVILGLVGLWESAPQVSLVATAVVSAVCNAFYAVAMHRRRLFGQTPATSKVRWQVGPAEGVFLAFGLTLSLVYGVLIGVLFAPEAPSVVAYVLLASMFIVLPLVAGASLIFPAAAQGQLDPVSVGWHLGKGIRLRLLAIIFVTALPLSIVSQIIAAIPVAGQVLPAVLQFLIAATVIAALCIAYKARTSDLEQQNSPQPDPAAP